MIYIKKTIFSDPAGPFCAFPTDIYLLEVNKGNTAIISEICSKLTTMETPEQCVKFVQI